MFTKRFNPFQTAVAAGALAALFAAASAQAVDQSAWLQEQLAATDGASYVSFVPGEKGTSTYHTDAQSAWLQEQLAISDGFAAPDRRIAETVYGGVKRSGGTPSHQQIASAERAVYRTDGCNE